MIKIRDSNGDLLAILTEYTGPVIREAINGEYTFAFTVVMDDKSEYISEEHFAEVNDQYFSIIHLRQMRNRDGSLVMQVNCEQVSFELLDVKYDSFIQAGTPADVLAFLLDGTDFTVGIVEPADLISVSLAEATNARAALLAIVEATGGELSVKKHEISILNRRGTDRGVQFRVEKNLLGIIRDIDRSSGEVKISYEVDVLELNQQPGYEGLEYFELGDSVRIIDKALGINEIQRIVSYEYDPRQRINSSVEIANFTSSLHNIMTSIQQTTVVKDRIYNGTRIGPENGFEAIRSDNRARTVMNATDGVRIQQGDGSGGTWTDAFYADLDGNLVLTGEIYARGGEIGGWSITEDMLFGDGKIQGGEITGALIQTSESFPRSEMNVDGNYFGAFADGEKAIKISAFYSNSNRPVLSFSSGGYDVTLDQPSPGYFDITAQEITLDANVAIPFGQTLYVHSWDKIKISDATTDLGSELASKATYGALTTAAGGHNHGIPNGTVLMTADGGTVTFVVASNHSHVQV